MKKLALIAIGIASLAYAQNRTITVRTVDVDVVGAHVLILPDAGCTIQAIARSTVPGTVVDTKVYPMNGANCANIALRAERAAFLDIGVGDGGRP